MLGVPALYETFNMTFWDRTAGKHKLYPLDFVRYRVFIFKTSNNEIN